MMKKSGVSRKKKKVSLILIRVMLVLIPTFSVLFVIGNHSDYLIKNFLKWIFLALLIISVIVLLVSSVIYFKNKDSGRVISKKKLFWVCNFATVVYIIGCSAFLSILYGSWPGFRDWLISTAMQTMNHQYYCKIFYDEDEIQNTRNRHYIIESGEETDPSLITGVEKEEIQYENEYERQVLERENKDQLYKIVKFEVNSQDAYLAVIYDVSRVHVAHTKWLDKWGQYVTQMAEDHDAILAINGGGFADTNYNSNGQTPIGTTISYGKIVTNYGYVASSGGTIGLTEDNVLVLLKNKSAEEAQAMGVREAVTMGPFLIVNGKPSFTKGNGGWGYAARTAIGQRADGILLFLVVDSNETRSKGASMTDLTQIMQNYGAINAANLDGGTSSVMVLPKIEAQKYKSCEDNYCNINDPIDSALRHKTRPIATSWILK